MNVRKNIRHKSKTLEEEEEAATKNTFKGEEICRVRSLLMIGTTCNGIAVVLVAISEK